MLLPFDWLHCTINCETLKNLICLAGQEKYNELLEAWFPAKGKLPSAFLLDTSEEALLLPDWLKLRMIRCNVEPLVNAGR